MHYHKTFNLKKKHGSSIKRVQSAIDFLAVFIFNSLSLYYLNETRLHVYYITFQTILAHHLHHYFTRKSVTTLTKPSSLTNNTHKYYLDPLQPQPPPLIKNVHLIPNTPIHIHTHTTLRDNNAQSPRKTMAAR